MDTETSLKLVVALTVATVGSLVVMNYWPKSPVPVAVTYTAPVRQSAAAAMPAPMPPVLTPPTITRQVQVSNGDIVTTTEHPPGRAGQYRCVFENGRTRPIYAGESGTGWCADNNVATNANPPGQAGQYRCWPDHRPAAPGEQGSGWCVRN